MAVLTVRVCHRGDPGSGETEEPGAEAVRGEEGGGGEEERGEKERCGVEAGGGGEGAQAAGQAEAGAAALGPRVPGSSEAAGRHAWTGPLGGETRWE